MTGLVCGSLGASSIGDILTRTKSGWGSSRANVRAALVAERLTGVPAASFTNAAMQWGIDTESQGRAAYEFMTDSTVTLTDPVPHPSLKNSHASPDGLVGADGQLEIKCPNTATHIATLLARKVPEKYGEAQIPWQLACTGRKWCDFVSFDPRMPPRMQLYVQRVYRDDKLIAQLEKEVTVFLGEVDAEIAALRTHYDLENTLKESA